MTVREAVERATVRLREAGCASPRLDAELLLAFVLGAGRTALVLAAREVLAPDAIERFEALVVRREAREPVAYITGRREFRRISLCVDPRVLIPRPETELLVEVALTLPHGSRVLDVGTGSGAVALALADERPDLTILGSDISDDALAVARVNARQLDLDVSFVRADLTSGLPGSFDAVLANLPYVEQDDPRLAPEITRYEPPLALFAGPDGLDVVRRLISQLHDVPFVALEVGHGQAGNVEALLRERGFGEVERHRDLAGHQRVIVGRR